MIRYFIVSMLASSLFFFGCEKPPAPDWVWTDKDKLLVVIQEFGGRAYVYKEDKDGHFELFTEIKPTSPHYPMPKKEVEVDGKKRTAYVNNTQKMKEHFYEVDKAIKPFKD